jgi:hypothetical protein
VKQPMDCACEGVYSRVEHACGECKSVSSGRKKAPGENPFGCFVQFPITSA